jgi:hypothetical protein
VSAQNPNLDVTRSEYAAWVCSTQHGITTNGEIDPRQVHVESWDARGRATLMVPTSGCYSDAQVSVEQARELHAALGHVLAANDAH